MPGQAKLSTKAIMHLSRVALVAMLCLSFGPSPDAFAQQAEDKEIIVAQSGLLRGFNPFSPLQKLFGNKERRRGQQPQQQVKKRRAPARAAGTPPKYEAVAKDENAGVILVVGDRMARGVADGLDFIFSEKPQIRVERITEDKLGFAGEGAPDWSTRALAKIRGDDVKAVVVMIGRQDLGKPFPGEVPVEFMTQEWIDAYRNKVEGFVRVVRQEKKPIVWAGLPPTNTETVNADFTQLNSIFQSLTEDRRVRYVDIWDIFLAEDGSYSSFGPDVDGKNTRLRTQDRIGFTWPGYQKVAFFVDRELLRLLGGYGGLAFEGIEDDPNFIVLTGRTTSPEALLLGGEDDEGTVNRNSSAYRFFVKGDPLPPMPGRVDDPRMAVEGTSVLEEAIPSGS